MKPVSLRIGGGLLGPSKIVQLEGELLSARALPDAAFFNDKTAQGRIELYRTPEGYRVLRAFKSDAGSTATFLARGEDAYELAVALRCRDRLAISELRNHDAEGEPLSESDVAETFPHLLGLNRPALPTNLPSYAVAGDWVLATDINTARSDAAALHAAGYTCLLNLEDPTPAHPIFEVPADAASYRIRDFTPPTPDQARRACRQIDAWIKDGKGVVVHCIGGSGRSGTLLAAYAAWRERISGEDAIRQVRSAAARRRFGYVIETREQEQLVRDWARSLQA